MIKALLAIPISKLFASLRQLRLISELGCLQISLIPQGSILMVSGRGLILYNSN